MDYKNARSVTSREDSNSNRSPDLKVINHSKSIKIQN